MDSENDKARFEPLALRMTQAERLSGISQSVLYRLARKGELEIVKLGASNLVMMASLKSLLNRLPRK
jgi:predicted DNA-binding transcriptional regulator AlpA